MAQGHISLSPTERPGETGLPINLAAERPDKTTNDAQANTSTRGKSRHNFIKP
jgi:hypothetical protein